MPAVVILNHHEVPSDRGWIGLARCTPPVTIQVVVHVGACGACPLCSTPSAELFVVYYYISLADVAGGCGAGQVGFWFYWVGDLCDWLQILAIIVSIPFVVLCLWWGRGFAFLCLGLG